jgi:hypothetical protein
MGMKLGLSGGRERIGCGIRPDNDGIFPVPEAFFG